MRERDEEGGEGGILRERGEEEEGKRRGRGGGTSHKGTLPLTPARREVFTTLTSTSLFFTDGATGKVMVTVETFWLHRNAMLMNVE